MLDPKTLKAVESWLNSKIEAKVKILSTRSTRYRYSDLERKFMGELLYELESKRSDIECAIEATS